jgi:ABC-2 type transport system ATP-binding protein
MMIARALMHAPAVLFLDEPSTGLDPAARLFLWEKVAELKAGGTTVVITTHDMDEAATLSDRVAIIDHGTLLALDAPAALVRGMTGERTLDCTIEPTSGGDRRGGHRHHRGEPDRAVGRHRSRRVAAADLRGW